MNKKNKSQILKRKLSIISMLCETVKRDNVKKPLGVMIEPRGH